MNKVDKDTIYVLYVIRGKPMHEIAKDLDISVGSVYNYIHKYGITTRTKKESFDILKNNGWEYPMEARKRISKAHKGKKVTDNTRKKMSESAKVGGIGHKKKRCDGYIAIYFPDHPQSNKDGYIMEHDLVMECVIGRHLKENEIVHHKNKIRNDNRIENLELMTFKEHAALHMRERLELKKGGMTYQ